MSAPTRAANLRDVADAAPGLLARGVLLRAEAPQPGDDAPTHVAWPPRTVLDLRSPHELGGAPHPLAGVDAHVVAVPTAGALAPDAVARARDADTPLAGLYLDVLDAAAGWLPILVTHAARAPGPVLVHCAAGKDRTGIAVALLLALAEVPRRAVEHDYARTADGLDGVHVRLDAAAARAGTVRTVPQAHRRVAPDAIAAVLDRCARHPGGATGFARAHGAAPDDLATWRARIRPAVRSRRS